jgi:hypothetical protein
LSETSPIRFAVGTFEHWQQLQKATKDLRRHGLDPRGFTYLAVRRSFNAGIVWTDAPLLVLEFQDAPEPISCTAGALSDCLQARIAAGARTLKEALAYWLLPRHAAHFQQMIDQGKIQLWIKLARADEERSAYESLLADSSNSVGVHDLTPRVAEASLRHFSGRA